MTTLIKTLVIAGAIVAGAASANAKLSIDATHGPIMVSVDDR